MQAKPATPLTSSEKDGANEKTYRIPISTGIFKRCPDMLDSVWLFLWYIDKTTKETAGEGAVLGGVPVTDSEPAKDLRVSLKVARKWRLHLASKGYTRTRRTPYGYVITLLKSKKWGWGPVLVTDKPAPRELPKREISPEENCPNGKSDLPKREERIAQTGKYKEDRTGQNKDRAVEAVTAAAALLLKRRNAEEWKAINIAPAGTGHFQEAWRQIYESRPETESLSDCMERCIQSCNESGIPVPKTFYEAKRLVEKLPDSAGGSDGVGNGGLPRLEPLNRPEVHWEPGEREKSFRDLWAKAGLPRPATREELGSVTIPPKTLTAGQPWGEVCSNGANPKTQKRRERTMGENN